jgi:cell wall-associated NlpC family hydrolase
MVNCRTGKTVKAAGVCVAAFLGFVGSIQMMKAAPITDYDQVVFSTAEDYVNIREGAGIESTIIGKFYHNSMGRVLERSGEWILIESGSISGYVNSAYVVTGEEAQMVSEEALQQVATVDAQGLYLRREPDLAAEILDTVTDGEEYTIVEEAGEWVKVLVRGQEGYLYKEHTTQKEEYSEAVSLEEDAQLHTQPGDEIVNYALQFVGNPYVWGGTSLTGGADCSGFSLAVFADFGYQLPRTSRAQAQSGVSVGQGEMQAGDLVFYSSGGSINHVAIYMGNGQVVHASNERNGIMVSDVNYRIITKVVRYL